VGVCGLSSQSLGVNLVW